jgi:hypothetical protein
MIRGQKSIDLSYNDGDGFLQGTYDGAIAVNGVSVVAVIRPKRNTTETAWSSIVDLFYNRVVLGVRNATGQIHVFRNGTPYVSTTEIPDSQVTILSLVIQPDGKFAAYGNGVQMVSTTETSAMTSLVPNVAGDFANAFNIGRNKPDGWSAFNGQIGDVFVYKVALTETERKQLEADLAAKFLSTN